VLIAYLSDMKYATSVDHLIYGWFFFGLVVLLMFWIGSFWRESAVEDQGSGIADQSVTDPVASSVVTGVTGRYAVWTLAVVLTAAVGPLWATWTSREDSAVAPIVLQSPPAIAPWQGPVVETDSWEPQFNNPDTVVRSQYSLDGRRVHLYIAYYRQQRPDAKLVSSQNSLYDRKHWRYISVGDGVQISVAGRKWPFQVTLLTDGQRRKLVWSGYWEGGRLVVSPYVAKLWEAWDRLSGAQRGSAFIAIAADDELQPNEAEVLLRQFLETMGPGIDALLMNASH
jgi:EpsI family protein